MKNMVHDSEKRPNCVICRASGFETPSHSQFYGEAMCRLHENLECVKQNVNLAEIERAEILRIAWQNANFWASREERVRYAYPVPEVVSMLALLERD